MGYEGAKETLQKETVTRGPMETAQPKTTLPGRFTCGTMKTAQGRCAARARSASKSSTAAEKRATGILSPSLPSPRPLSLSSLPGRNPTPGPALGAAYPAAFPAGLPPWRLREVRRPGTRAAKSSPPLVDPSRWPDGEGVCAGCIWVRDRISSFTICKTRKQLFPFFTTVPSWMM